MRKILIISLLFLTACSTFVPALFPVSAPAAVLDIRTHPDGMLYAGDLVSFEVINPVQDQTNQGSVKISLDGKVLGDAAFSNYGLGNRSQATFYWVWDTRSLKPGDYKLTFTLQPQNIQEEKVITLLPGNQMPPPGAGASWKAGESACCVIRYVTGTDAERDLEKLKILADAQAADVEKRMQVTPKQKIPLAYFPRTLGHGGFASEGIYISYLDQNYAGSTTAQVTHHEMVHWFDGQLGGSLRPSMMQEGLAVYLSGGHFKPEPLIPRAAALLDLGWYIPLRTLVDSFYTQQHEIGYAEAGAFIAYLVNVHGWDGFNSFYRSIQPAADGKESSALDNALQKEFHQSLTQLETSYKEYLQNQAFQDEDRQDLQTTVAFYNAVRRYESLLDPSAYFLYAWLPDVKRMQNENITADFSRHPMSITNTMFENLLIQGNKDLLTGDLKAADRVISLVNSLLDFYEKSH